MNIKRSSKVIMALLLAASALFTTELMAQDLKKPTLEDLLSGGETYRIIENLPNLRWWGDVCIKPGIDSLFAVNPKTGKETLLTTREKVNQVLNSLITPTATTAAVSGQKRSKVQHFYNTEFPWPDKPYMLIKLPAEYIVYDFEKDEFVQGMPQAGERKGSDIDYTPEGGHIAYTVKNNLFVDNKAVTKEPEGIVCGQSVHRNEFGISKGTFWSPQGDLLAFYRMNESMVTPYPLVDITPRIALVDKIRYPMAGMLSHQVSVGIYNPDTQKTIYLNTGDPTNRYFTNISWSPDEKSIYVIELNRDQNHSQLVRYNAETGAKEAMLFEETHPKYVEPQHPIVFLPWDSNQFIYWSQRDGFHHLYLYNKEGQLIKQLTQGDWLVQDILGFNTARKEMIIASTEISPLQTNIFSLNVKTGKRTLLGQQDGTHSARLSASGTYLIDNFTSFNVPREISILPTNGKTGINLLTATDPMKEQYNLPEITLGTIKAADGKTDLYYRLIKPVNFDPNKKYPAIIYVYGGPHAQLIHNNRFYDARGWDLYMAQKGYVMLTVDSRGSDNRGLEFENCTFRQLGVEEMKDQVEGAKFLQSLPYVNADKIGVHGWSFGGFMTTNLMLTYPEIFKVGVAGGPVIDWQYYEVMYGERYMDTPQTNPEGYKNSNLKLKAGNLKGRLEVIIGGADPTCVPQHSYTFLRACIDAGTHPDFFVYPEDGHNMMGRDRVHLHEHITRYFEDHLK